MENIRAKKPKKILKLFTPDQINALKLQFEPSSRGRLPSITHRSNGISIKLRLKNWVTDRSRKKPTLYLWDDLFYCPIEESTFGYFIQRIFEACGWPDYSNRVGSEIYTQTINRIFEMTIRYNIHLNDQPDYIVFDWGYYNIRTHKIEDPDPKLYISQKINVDRSPDANCPKFKALIDLIIPEFKTHVLCHMARCMTSGIYDGIAQIWTGAGANGKSQLTDILSLIVGETDVSHVSLGKLLNRNNRFASYRLKGKKVNIGSEVTSQQVGGNGIEEIKRILTNRYLDGEDKHKAAEEWINTTKHIFDVNELPLPSSYMDYAFFRRWKIIPFKYIIPVEKRIKEYGVKIFREEGPAIVNYLLSYLDKADEVLMEDAPLAEKMWHLYSQSVFSFVEHHCQVESDFWTSTSILYSKYLQFCKLHARSKVSKVLFGKLFRKAGAIPSRRNNIYGYRVFCMYPQLVEDQFEELSDDALANIEEEVNTMGGNLFE